MSRLGLQFNQDGRVVIDAAGRAIAADPAMGSAQPCCCAASACNSYRPAAPRCAPVGQCGFGLIYLCTQIMTNLGRTIEEMVQGVGGPPGSGVGRWIRINGECYRIDNMAGAPITRDQVDESLVTCPGRVVNDATIIEMGALPPGEDECAECGCCEVITLNSDDCAFATEGACAECSNEYDVEASVTATIEQVMTAAGLDVFYPFPTPRPPEGVVYRGEVTIQIRGRKICTDGVSGWECSFFSSSITQRIWNQNTGEYQTSTTVSNGCESPWAYAKPQCGADSAGRGRFSGFDALSALRLIEIGSFLNAQPLIANGFGPPILAICTTNGPEIERTFTVPAAIPAAGNYTRHEQRWSNIASAMASSCSGVARELYFDDYAQATGQFRHLWTNTAFWNASRRFDETQACDDNGPRCDSQGIRREAQKRGPMSAEQAVRSFASTAEMLRAMGR